MIRRFLRVDWAIPVAHRPAEIAAIFRLVAKKGRASRGEVFVEAGCWQGGSSAKFSHICDKLGYRLLVYDSFQGVEKLSADELAKGGHDFSGEFAAPEDVFRENLAQYGRPEICSVKKGWFSDTLAGDPVKEPVRFVYIDCDTAKGTREVLAGILPELVEDAIIFSQDYHIPAVRETLHDPDTWAEFGREPPTIQYVAGNVAAIQVAS